MRMYPLLLAMMLVAAYGSGAEPVADSPTVSRPATVRTLAGDVLVGKLIDLNGDSVVIRTALGDLTVALDQVAAIEFFDSKHEQSGFGDSIKLPGYAIADASSEAISEFPETIRVFIGSIEQDRALRNVVKKLSSKSTARRLGNRKLEIVEEATKADVILLRTVGDDIRTKVGSSTMNTSYIDVLGGGGLKTAPVTRVHSIETVDLRTAVLVVDHENKVLQLVSDKRERIRNRTTRSSGLDVVNVFLDLVDPPSEGEEEDEYRFPRSS